MSDGCQWMGTPSHLTVFITYPDFWSCLSPDSPGNLVIVNRTAGKSNYPLAHYARQQICYPVQFSHMGGKLPQSMESNDGRNLTITVVYNSRLWSYLTVSTLVSFILTLFYCARPFWQNNADQ